MIENTNCLLLGRLKHLCAPNHDSTDDTKTNPVPENWPEYLDEALHQLNDQILPALNTSPRGLLFKLPLQPNTPVPPISLPTSVSDIHVNTTLTENFCVNAHLLSLEDVNHRKTSFNKNTPLTTFSIGNLIQVYDSASDFNYSIINKLAPKWSEPRIIYGEFSNSFSLCTMSGIPLKGFFHSCRL